MAKKSFGEFTPFEKKYGRNLRKISRAVASIIETNTVNGQIVDPQKLEAQLASYADLLDGWAKAEAEKMFNTVEAWNKRTFASHSEKIGTVLKETLADKIIGLPAQLWQQKQVELIKSLPLESAKKAQELARKASMFGERPEAIAQQIKELGTETGSRATLIARTEIAKANASLTKARSEFVGATHYRWRTMKDSRVRDSHREMDGVIVAWANPPTLSDGMTGHAGEFPNCRCYAEPLIDEEAKLDAQEKQHEKFKERKVKFGEINDVDLSKPKEEINFGRFATAWEKEKTPYYNMKRWSQEKMDTLNFSLKQAGHKGVKPTDFKGAYGLRKIIDDPVLFKKYPELHDVNVVFADFHTAKKRGLRVDKTLFLNSKLYEKDPLRIKGTLVHEIEHLKQDIKGMKDTTAIEELTGTGRFAKAYQSEREVQARAKQAEYYKQVGWSEPKKK